ASSTTISLHDALPICSQLCKAKYDQDHKKQIISRNSNGLAKICKSRRRWAQTRILATRYLTYSFTYFVICSVGYEPSMETVWWRSEEHTSELQSRGHL